MFKSQFRLSEPVWKSLVQTVGENWDLKLAQISIWVIRIGLEILSPNGRGKNWGLEPAQTSIWGIGLSLEIHPNGRGKIGI